MTAEQIEWTQIRRWITEARRAILPIDGKSPTEMLSAMYFVCNALIETVELQQRQIDALQKKPATPSAQSADAA